jgi:hypothetical protein
MHLLLPLLLLLQALPQGKVYSYNPSTKETHLATLMA